MNIKISFFALILILFFSCTNKNNDTSLLSEKKNVEVYDPTWQSLSKNNEAPEWLQDAKLGIYFHWGVYSVPEYGNEWYPRTMYLENSNIYNYHKKTYGSDFGYKDFVPMFTAKNFNAEEWVKLFKKAGAKFAGPVAQHHDGFAMWKSSVNPWNSFNKGPKVDITGEIAKEIRKNDMKLITTFHHSRNLQRNADNPDKWNDFNSHYPYLLDYDTSSKDPEISKLYGNMPSDEFNIYWSNQIKEVVDQYQPDMIWFDSWFNSIPEETVKNMCAYYYNTSLKNNQETTIGYKQSDLPKEVGIQDIEQGGRRDITERPWMTDITLSYRSWSYVKKQTYKPASMVIRNLIDVVSKNGIVLLNISPKADGTIPVEQQEVLTEMGDWFSKYGESIYNTRPWDLFGFGNAKANDGSHGGQSATVNYTADDIRFTQSKDEKSLYLFFLGKPKPGDKISLRLLAKHRYTPHTPIKRILLLNTDTEVEFNHSNYGFELIIPDAPMDELATVFKFELE